MTAPSLVLTVALAAGCVVHPRAGFDDLQKLVADRTPHTLRWNQGTPEDAEADERVRQLLAQPLTVESATQIALLNNPKLQATYERLGVAQADLVQAGLLRNPSIGGHIGFPLGSSILELEGSISGEFIDLFLIPLRKKMARAELRRAKLEVADSVLALAAEVRSGFYSAQAAAQIVELRRMVLEAAQALAELAMRQHQAGNLSDLDLANEQSQYVESRLAFSRAELALLADRERLTQLLGVWGRATDWTVAGPVPELPPSDPPLERVESLAVERRFDLAAAREEAQTIAASLQITKGTRFIGGLEAGAAVHQDADGPKTLGPTLRLELPIFDQKQAAIAKLRAELRAAERRVDALAIGVRSEVRMARTRLLAARATVNYYRATFLPLRERIVTLSQQQYNAMLLGVYQLLQSKQAETEAYRDYIESVRDYWIARSDLERAVGGAFGGKGN